MMSVARLCFFLSQITGFFTEICYFPSGEQNHFHKDTTYDVKNPSPGLRQARKCGGVRLVNGLPTPS